MRCFVVLFVLFAGDAWAQDFNNDGEVNFSDYILFAGKFGAVQGDELYSPEFDLDSNGEIDLADFMVFSSRFGQDVSAAKIARIKELEEAAKQYQDRGQYAEAVERYTELLNLASTPLGKSKGMKHLGLLYIKMNDLDNALSYFQKALNEFKQLEDRRVRYQIMWCNFGLGEIELLKGDQGKAALYFEQSKQFLPN